MFRTHFFRWLAIPVCILVGLMELVALHRRHRLGPVLMNDSDKVCRT
ncbi:MAG: hypothetical protein PHH58_01510 [Rhodoferax sp.]|nr:hypothetical protein [Rhodoferax sp.]